MNIKDIPNINRGKYPLSSATKDIEQLQKQLRALRWKLLVDYDCLCIDDLDNADGWLDSVKDQLKTR